MALGLTNISTTVVKAEIGSSSDNIGLLCTDANINVWSRYKPGYLTVAATYITYQPPRGGFITDPRGLDPDWNLSVEAYKIDDFRGYNHSAIAPTLNATADMEYQSSEAGQAGSRGITFNFGEVNWKMLEETTFRSLNFLIEPLYLILTDESTNIKGSALLPATIGGYETITYNFTVPAQGATVQYTARIAFGITDSNIAYWLGNNYGAIGTRTFNVKCLYPRQIGGVTWDDFYITGGLNPPYTSIDPQGTTANLFTGTNVATWKYVDVNAFRAYYDYPTLYDDCKSITANWYIKGFKGQTSVEYLAKTQSVFQSNSAANSVTLPVSGSPATFGDGDVIILILRNITINY